jgi:hypothetical protein
MRVYHRTHHFDAIEREGFRDGYKALVLEDGGMLELRGVFVSAEWPLDENEGAHGDVVLELDVPEALFIEYEHVEEDGAYREAMIPAVALNAHRATLRRLSDDEIDVLTIGRWNYWVERLGHERATPDDATE